MAQQAQDQDQLPQGFRLTDDGGVRPPKGYTLDASETKSEAIKPPKGYKLDTPSLPELKKDAEARAPIRPPKGYALDAKPYESRYGERLHEVGKWVFEPTVPAPTEATKLKIAATLTGSEPDQVAAEHPVALGVTEGVTDIGRSLTSPFSLATILGGPMLGVAGRLAGLSPTAVQVASRTLAGLFAAQAARGTYQDTQAAYAAYLQGRNREAARAATGAIFNLGAAAFAGKHAARGGYEFMKGRLKERLPGMEVLPEAVPEAGGPGGPAPPAGPEAPPAGPQRGAGRTFTLEDLGLGSGSAPAETPVEEAPRSYSTGGALQPELNAGPATLPEAGKATLVQELEPGLEPDLLDRIVQHAETEAALRRNLEEMGISSGDHQALIDAIQAQGENAFAEGDMKAALEAAHNHLLLENIIAEGGAGAPPEESVPRGTSAPDLRPETIAEAPLEPSMGTPGVPPAVPVTVMPETPHEGVPIPAPPAGYVAGIAKRIGVGKKGKKKAVPGKAVPEITPEATPAMISAPPVNQFTGDATSPVVPPASEPEKPKTVAALIDGFMKRAAMEAQGQELLDDMIENKENPSEIEKKFWRDTYFKLPGNIQKRFQRMLKSLSGMQPGDAIATDKDGKAITAKTWMDIADHPIGGTHLGDDAEYLEGGDRGYAVLMREANRAMAGVPSKTQAGGKAPAATALPLPPQEPVTPVAETPLHEKPLAGPGLKSYRYRGPFGWIMIGATDEADALKQATRSVEQPELVNPRNLEAWDDVSAKYLPVKTQPAPSAKSQAPAPVPDAVISLPSPRSPELDAALTSAGLHDTATARVISRALQQGAIGSKDQFDQILQIAKTIKAMDPQTPNVAAILEASQYGGLAGLEDMAAANLAGHPPEIAERARQVWDAVRKPPRPKRAGKQKPASPPVTSIGKYPAEALRVLIGAWAIDPQKAEFADTYKEWLALPDDLLIKALQAGGADEQIMENNFRMAGITPRDLEQTGIKLAGNQKQTEHSKYPEFRQTDTYEGEPVYRAPVRGGEAIISHNPGYPWRVDLPHGESEGGFDTAEEAMEAIRRSPRYQPAPKPGISPLDVAFARATGGRVKIGADPKALAEVLGSSLYGKDPAEVIVKELMQNSWDAIRRSKDVKEVTVVFDRYGGVITVSDTGQGMTRRELETVFTDLGRTGKLAQADASGGFGIAKAAPFMMSEKLTVTTIHEEKGKFYRHSFVSTPDEIVNKGVEVTSEELPGSGYSTGTVIEATLKPGTGTHSAEDFVRKSQRSLRPPGSLVVKGLNSDYGGSIPEVGKTPIVTETAPGAKLSLYASQKEKTYGKWDSIHVEVNNNGIYQFDMDLYPPAEGTMLPERVAIDVRATVKERDKDYPFLANREDFRSGEVKEKIRELVNKNIFEAAVKQRNQQIGTALRGLPVIKIGATEIPIFDSGKRLTDEEMEQLKSDPAFIDLAHTIHRVTRDAIAALGTEELSYSLEKLGKRIKKIGIVFSDKLYGVHISDPEDPQNALLFINPFQAIKDSPTRAASTIWHTIKHELIHDQISGHSENFTSAEVMVAGALGSKRELAAIQELEDVYADPTHPGAIRPDLGRALQLYGFSRVRPEVARDIFRGEGLSAELPAGREAGVRTGGEEAVPGSDDASLEDALDGLHGDRDAAKALLKRRGAKYAFSYPGGEIYTHAGSVVDLEDDGYATYHRDADDYVRQANLDVLAPDWDSRFNDEFWKNPGTLYHATPDENVAAILKHGLNTANRTRGLSNRSVMSSVFTVEDPESLADGSYGDNILAIDMEGLGKTDKPYVEQEPDIAEGAAREALASRLGVENYQYDYEQGIIPDTVIVHGGIPAKYLSMEGEPPPPDESLGRMDREANSGPARPLSPGTQERQRPNIALREILPGAKEHQGKAYQNAIDLEQAQEDLSAADREIAKRMAESGQLGGNTGVASIHKLRQELDQLNQRRRAAYSRVQVLSRERGDLEAADPNVGEVRMDAQGNPTLYLNRTAMRVVQNLMMPGKEGLLKGADWSVGEARWIQNRMKVAHPADTYEQKVWPSLTRLLDTAIARSRRGGIALVGKTGQGVRSAIDTMREELIHRWQRSRTANGMPDTHLQERAFARLFVALPGAAYDYLRDAGYDADPTKGGARLLVIEAAAKIMAGKWRRMGLNEQEASNWLKRYRDEVIEEHGPQAIIEIKHTRGFAKDMQREVEQLYGTGKEPGDQRADAGGTTSGLPGGRGQEGGPVDDRSGREEDGPQSGRPDSGLRQEPGVSGSADGEQRTGGGERTGPGVGRASLALKADTPEFKRWFGDSKVVDESGAPLKLYHGTTRKNPKVLRQSFEAGSGVFLTDSEDVASTFTLPREYGESVFEDEDGNEIEPGDVVPVYARIENPLVIDDEDEEYEGPWAQEVSDDTAVQARVLRQAKADGHDGVILRNVKEGIGERHRSDTYIVFDPKQVKHAERNSGAYGSDTANILMDREGAKGKPQASLSDKDIDHWTGYFRNLTFKSETEARERFFGKLEHEDRQSYAELFGKNGPEKNRAMADAMPVYREGKTFKIGRKPKAGPVSKERLGSAEPEGKHPPVDFFKEDLQDSGPVTEESVLRDYNFPRNRKAVTYKAYVPVSDVPDPVLAEEDESIPEEDRGTYSWEDFNYGNRSFPPAKLLVQPNGKVQIQDGNHRIKHWIEAGYDSIPAWVIDQRRGVKPDPEDGGGILKDRKGSARGNAKVTSSVKEDIDGRPRHSLKVAGDAGNEVGSMELIEKEDEIKVDEVNVRPGHWGKGYGKALYRKAIEIARDRGKPLVSSISTSESARSVWRSLGAKEFEEGKSGVTRYRIDPDPVKTVRAFHGTRAGDFDEFRPRYRPDEQLGFGIHFAADQDLAERYAVDDATARKGKKPTLYTVNLGIRKLLNADDIVKEGSAEFALAEKLAGKKLYTQKNEDGARMVYLQNAIDMCPPRKAERIIREAGYDGIEYTAKITSQVRPGMYQKHAAGKSYVVFDPAQVEIISREAKD